jgi:hypothetical protein
MVSVWNTPHGIPQRISATSRWTTVCAVKKMAVKQTMRDKHPIRVYL